MEATIDSYHPYTTLSRRSYIISEILFIRFHYKTLYSDHIFLEILFILPICLKSCSYYSYTTLHKNPRYCLGNIVGTVVNLINTVLTIGIIVVILFM